MSPSALRKRTEHFKHTTTNSLALWRTTCRPKILLEEHKGGIDTFLCHAVSCAAVQKIKEYTKPENYVRIQQYLISSLYFTTDCLLWNTRIREGTHWQIYSNLFSYLSTRSITIFKKFSVITQQIITSQSLRYGSRSVVYCCPATSQCKIVSSDRPVTFWWLGNARELWLLAPKNENGCGEII
jgi:hypothetical protein